MNLQESIRKILREEDYSPAGKEVTPKEIVVHKSNTMFRDKIMENGLKARAGECYKIYAGYGEKCIPAIFATNSTNKRAWFDSTYDDDIWFIDTTMIPDVKWYKDRHYESKSKHIVTFQDIPKEAITLKYEGTGKSDYNIQESIRRILKEETQGVDSLIQTLSSKYEISEELKNFIVNFINNSNCKRIDFSNLKMPVMGLALHDGVLINNMVLGRTLEFALFVIFHEIAHQYQFKKYGEDVMYKCYIGEVSLDDASKFMKNTEEVADEFATRKMRELEKKGLLKKGFIPPQVYKNMPLSQIQGMTHMFREQMKMNKIKSPEKISEYFYNMVKSEL